MEPIVSFLWHVFQILGTITFIATCTIFLNEKMPKIDWNMALTYLFMGVVVYLLLQPMSKNVENSYKLKLNEQKIDCARGTIKPEVCKQIFDTAK